MSAEPACPMCLDSHWLPGETAGDDGYVDSIPCDCNKPRRIEILDRYSMIGPRLRYRAEHKLDEHEHQAAAKMALHELCSSQRRGVLLCGPPGSGKSIMAARAVHLMQQAGTPVLWLYWPKAVEHLRDFDRWRDRPWDPGSPQSWEHRIIHAEVLVVDDLGVERLTPFAAEKLDTILEARDQRDGRIIVTTNLAAELPEHIGDRSASRLLRSMCNGAVLKLPAIDLRQMGDVEIGAAA